MNQKQPMTEWIRLVCTPRDKEMLEAVRQHNGDDSESAAIRRLIRTAARELGLNGEAEQPAAPAGK